MNIDFSFTTATQIIFGAGKISNLPEIIHDFGKKMLLVTRKNYYFPKEVENKLNQEKINILRYEVSGEPDVDTIQKGVELARKNGVEYIISFGGGSVIDTGKAIAALILNKGEVLDYLEVVGAGKKLTKPTLPFIAIPTTSGTGSEVTKNAVISVPDKKVKVSLRSNSMIPKIALIDPELTLSVPPNITASTGMDAFAQVLEPYVSIKANVLTDLFCLEGIKYAGRSLKKAYFQGENLQARIEMSWASLLGGLSLANAGLGAVHGIAGPFGGQYNAPHGEVVARLLPEVISINIRALQERAGNSETIQRYKTIFNLLLDHDGVPIQDGIDWFKELCTTLNIRTLSAYGAGPHDIPELVAKSVVSSSMKANPIKLSDDEVTEIIQKSL